MFKKPLLILIKIYQYTIPYFYKILDPSLGCRFYPSCSEYSFQAIEKYGIVKGIWLGVKRILKCHPFSRGGYNPLK